MKNVVKQMLMSKMKKLSVGEQLLLKILVKMDPGKNGNTDYNVADIDDVAIKLGEEDANSDFNKEVKNRKMYDGKQDEVDVSKTEFKNKDGSVKADSYEPIDVKGKREMGRWIHDPGLEVAQILEPRKGKDRVSKEGESVSSSIRVAPYLDALSSIDESLEGHKSKSINLVKIRFSKDGSLFYRSLGTEVNNNKSGDFKKRDDGNCDTPHENDRTVNAKGFGVNLVMKDNHLVTGQNPEVVKYEESPEGSDFGSPDKGGVRGTVKDTSDIMKSFEVDQKIRWKSKAPCNVFIDEIDEVERQRGAGLGWGNEWIFG